MVQVLRTNPGVLVWFLLFSIGALVCSAVGLMMARSGVSLRPIYWFAGLLLLIGLPQFGYHLLNAFATHRAETPRSAALKSSNSDLNAATNLFGADADPHLIRDARELFGDALSRAQTARFAVFPSGESALLARFNSHAEAEQAWVAYLAVTGLNRSGGKGDSERGYAVSRPVGDRAYAIPFGNLLGVWTGPDDAAIRRRMLAGGFEPRRRAPLARAAGESRTGGFGIPIAAAIGVPIWLFLVIIYFLKGAAWAGGAPARARQALPAGELIARLESINHLDVPFRVERAGREDELVVTWRYADAKWVDLARAHGMHRVHRIVLSLDRERQVVRATDYQASYDWSAGRGGAQLHWKASKGITFFEYSRERVIGLQLDEQGGLKPQLSYSYRFNLQELKQPIVKLVTEAGWEWRPVIWNGPVWLRWLTEYP